MLELLRQKQDSSGGYTGDDIIEIATILEVTPRGLRRRLNNWINTDGWAVSSFERMERSRQSD